MGAIDEDQRMGLVLREQARSYNQSPFQPKQLPIKKGRTLADSAFLSTQLDESAATAQSMSACSGLRTVQRHSRQRATSLQHDVLLTVMHIAHHAVAASRGDRDAG